MTYWYIVGGYLSVVFMVFGFKSALSGKVDDSDLGPSILWPIFLLMMLGALPVLAYRAYRRPIAKSGEDGGKRG